MGGLVGVGMGMRENHVWLFRDKPRYAWPKSMYCWKRNHFRHWWFHQPPPSMDEMKYDMHGSATTFGVMQALVASGHKERVIGVTCMAENMPSSNAQRPGDVITYSGKTVEVLNTDAEEDWCCLMAYGIRNTSQPVLHNRPRYLNRSLCCGTRA